jgi:hypothetical protein
MQYLSDSNSPTGLTHALLSLVRQQRHMSMRVVVSTQGSCLDGIWRLLDRKPSPRAYSFTICVSRTLQYHNIASLRIPCMVGALEKTYLCEDVK